MHNFMLQKISDIIIGLSGAGVRVTCYRQDVSTSVQRMVSIRRQCGPDQSPASTTTTAPPHPAQLGGGTQHINSNNNSNCCVQTVCGTKFAAINWLSPARKQKQRSGANDGHSHTQICPH